jgi:hypothetical protein
VTTEFKTLFTVGVTHAYYTEDCRDFSFALPEESHRTMRAARIICRPIDGKLHVLCEVRMGKPVVSGVGQVIRVGLKLSNPYFCNFTKLDFVPGGVVALYTNSGAPASVALLGNPNLTGSRFRHEPSTPIRPVELALHDSAARTIRSETLAGNMESSGFDLASDAAGLYTLTETYAVDPPKTFRYYVDPELKAEGVLAIAEIAVSEDFYATPAEFKISFAAREEVLKYYVVTHKYSDTEIAQLAVADSGFGEDNRPEVQFTKVLAADFTTAEIAPKLIAANGAKVVLFKSAGVLARSAKARRKIQLNRNGDTLISHLPQPGAGRPNADMIVHLSKP